MTDFEQKLINSRLEDPRDTNVDDFLSRLHNRVVESEQNRQILTASFMMLFVVGVLTFTQFGVPEMEPEFYFADEAETFFKTDFWTVNSDSLQADESYTDDLAYFLLQEGNLWETVELLNELELEEEITL